MRQDAPAPPADSGATAGARPGGRSTPGDRTVCIGLVTPAGDTRFEAPATAVQEARGAPARAGRGARRRTRSIRPGRQRPGTQPERAPAVPAPTAEAAVTADHPEGRAGIGPGGPVGSVPYRFTDKLGECRCPDCEQYP